MLLNVVLSGHTINLAEYLTKPGSKTHIVEHDRAAVSDLRVPIKSNAVFDCLTFMFSISSSMMIAIPCRTYTTKLSYVLCLVNSFTQFFYYNKTVFIQREISLFSSPHCGIIENYQRLLSLNVV